MVLEFALVISFLFVCYQIAFRNSVLTYLVKSVLPHIDGQ